ncbi:hypothetical protein E2P81_ATG06818 [Venturia nashicola]|uniref:Myb-like domain-containing protein n=1 Tax=Venturia nashicola TaxID=86259 RepID=A0A4Z1PEA9_9PEZI|nr:hypothetical protein E6O75_ATG06989 [Venturia nashicola]TLD30165.1 hypothetical protein E2P81_ATG06818 [Venturia nashicola]
MQSHQPLAPLSEGVRARKMAPTGGNRSWSEEEENYLLQTRMQKMPYKHIAAHLKKTELACRLHYHQLSHGSHRRKRTASLSSSSSSGGSVRHSPPQYHLNGDHHDDYASMHGLHNPYGSMNPLASYPSNNSPERSQHKLLLPKPRPLTPDDSPARLQGLRIHSNNNSPHGSNVDTDRLQQIYDAHRGNFWSAIASEYGSDVSPNQLEEVWRGAPGQPITPEDSPNSRALSIHPMLQPSPFPSFNNPMPQHYRKDYGPMSLPSSGPPPDRFNYGMPQMPTPIAPMQPNWNQQMGGMHHRSVSQSWGNQLPPATSINALLTEDKCPRQTDQRYTLGGHC